MFIRIIALLVCLATIVSCTLAVYDIPGWAKMATDFKVIICLIGGIATLMLGVLVLVPQQQLVVRPNTAFRKARL